MGCFRCFELEIKHISRFFTIDLISVFSSYLTSGIVRDRTAEYQRHLDRTGRHRKISKTSSEGFSDDYGEEEKTYKELFRSEKTFVKPSGPQPTFFKSRTNQLKSGGDSSPLSSDEQEWVSLRKNKCHTLSILLLKIYTLFFTIYLQFFYYFFTIYCSFFTISLQFL